MRPSPDSPPRQCTNAYLRRCGRRSCRPSRAGKHSRPQQPLRREHYTVRPPREHVRLDARQSSQFTSRGQRPVRRVRSEPRSGTREWKKRTVIRPAQRADMRTSVWADIGNPEPPRTGESGRPITINRPTLHKHKSAICRLPEPLWDPCRRDRGRSPSCSGGACGMVFGPMLPLRRWGRVWVCLYRRSYRLQATRQ
jgi:hypothetical protein